MIGLCDCNNFYVSCERLFNPALEGRAVVVMSSNDGCVIARSNEAKALGIKMSQPIFQIRDLVKAHNVEVISSNLQLYGDISQRVMATLREHIPAIEVYSIDEAFLDLSSYDDSQIENMARELARVVRRNTGIPVSIGVAPTKTLAKIASRLCKQYPALRGACFMHRPEDIDKVLSTYPVGDVWGIGRRSTAMLNNSNILTAKEFVESPQPFVKAKMGVTGVRTQSELRGESCISIDHNPSDRKSIMVSRSFSASISEFDQLHKAVATYASMAAEKLRRQGGVASQLQVFIRTNPFRDDLPQYSESEVVTFATPTSSTLEIASAARDALRAIFRSGFEYKKAGVVLGDISSSSGVQGSLFDTTQRDKHAAVMEAMDRLNGQMGRSTVVLGSQGGNTWMSGVSSEHRSPNYTTEWDDMLVINCK